MKTENPQQTTKVQLSHSKLYLWKTCPRQYIFRYSDKIKQIVWPGNLVGQTFHRALETSINLKTSGMDEQLILLNISGKFKEWYNEEVEKNKHDYKISQEVKRGGEKFYLLNDKLMTSFVKFILKYFYNLGDKEIILESEKEYSIDWDWDPEIQLNGFVDILLIGKDYYKIFDLKVTKDPTSYFYVNWASATQKIIYEYFIWKKYHILPSSFSYLVLNREEKYIFFKESSKTKNELQNVDVNNYFKKIDSELKTLKEFVLNPDINLANPEEQKCKWCIPYNKYCDLKYQSSYIRAVKKINKKTKIN